ncbi:molybdate ABC transporter substrate-binding protein [Bacillus sp. FJAT-29790]|uniref:molybdate ABC transporter substrate-binding protein n=1 Tax=Bacillus sp. FJAT-29790 TaxID=1895002 RepID=UPI001C243569|nr:molybdate ABC transporter substrate-binding protein [Bacillus sp. FJAT-29790]MBU8878361.1 molybdate ABC transporter substrate-binding protein [Bacillus sp. FJAT-29790]
MMKLRNSIFILLFLFILSACSSNGPAKQNEESKDEVKVETGVENKEITVSAAASLEDALMEIKPLFEDEHDNIKLLFNFGGSGALGQQITQGAPVDLFLSAAKDKFDELISQDLIEKDKGIDLVGNSLVLIIPKESKNSIASFEDLTNIGEGKLALGTPESVPAGKYASQTFHHLGIWDKVENNIVYTKDVRQVLTYVETGNVEAGVVYKTDAMLSDKIKIVAEADSSSHDPIIYPAGVIKTSKNIEEAEMFFQFLQEAKIKEIFQKYGFQVLD